MSELHKAYAVLGLDPGSSMESILRRYKRLIMVWHPDRAPSPEHKEFAEEELKKINNAKDLLAKHFGAGGGHKSIGCECQAVSSSGAGSTEGSGTRSGTGPGPSYSRTKSADEKRQEEEAARKRDERRKAQEAAEENARRAQRQENQNSANHTMESAVQQQRALQDEKLRWQISVGLVIAFVALEFFGAGAINAKHWWHDITWKWQNQSSSNSPSPSVTGSTIPTPYVEPYNQTPGGNPSSWAAEQAQRDKERDQQQRKKKDQDIYFAKLDIDKYQKIIEHCNSELANLEMKIADPYVSDYEKNKLREMRDFRQKNLAEGQSGLKIAQDKLAQLTGNPVQPVAPSLVSPLSGSGQSVPAVPSYSSPFAPPVNPGSNSLMPPSSPSFFRSKSFDPLNTPSPSTPANSFFDKKFGGLGTLSKPSSSTSSLSDLMDKYKSDKPANSLPAGDP